MRLTAAPGVRKRARLKISEVRDLAIDMRCARGSDYGSRIPAS
jgi:hypothetical protein